MVTGRRASSGHQERRRLGLGAVVTLVASPIKGLSTNGRFAIARLSSELSRRGYVAEAVRVTLAMARGQR
jgi:hypothetical protein